MKTIKMSNILDKQLPKRYWIYGETGTGKTLFTKVLAERLKTKIYKKTASGYWINYKGEKLIVIEDIGHEEWEFIKGWLKKWLDYSEFSSASLRNKETHEEIKAGEVIDPSEYHFVITSYKPLEEFLNQEKISEKGINERDISKIERLIEVYEMKHTDREEIQKDILEILKDVPQVK